MILENDTIQITSAAAASESFFLRSRSAAVCLPSAGSAEPAGIAERKSIQSSLGRIGRFSHPTATTLYDYESNLERFFDAFENFGDFTMAYATLQPGMKFSESHGGYIAYDCKYGCTFVLGDPVGPPAQHAEMLRSFVSTHRNVCFCQISRPTAEILSKAGWYVNELGTEVDISLPGYSFAGPKKTKLRQATSKMIREGYRITEFEDSEIDAESIHNLCATWLEGKSRRGEGRFMIRPLNHGDGETGVRRFFLLTPTEEMVAFIACDPICRDGRIIGYSTAIKRRSPIAPTGAEEALTAFAIEQFQREGLESVRLGLLPLHDVQPSEFGDAWPLRKFFQLAYGRSGDWFFNFQGHANFKRRFRGTFTKSYIATSRLYGNAVYLFGLMKLSNLF